MLAHLTSPPYGYATLLVLLVATSTTSLRLDERRLARAAASLHRQMEQLQRAQVSPDWLEGGLISPDDNFDEAAVEKRSDETAGMAIPPEAVLNNPTALRNYLRQVNEYFALIGRPRQVEI
ncbi:unnamed protein product [Mesocestoides corti]|uniref:Neuropeptide F n=1 Tax=Mesocestoides corti TaxID=53468 RepID=A0A0R3UJ34_MESCO|nr:unnamed protein product [Mesocestoides corti]